MRTSISQDITNFNSHLAVASLLMISKGRFHFHQHESVAVSGRWSPGGEKNEGRKLPTSLLIRLWNLFRMGILSIWFLVIARIGHLNMIEPLAGKNLSHTLRRLNFHCLKFDQIIEASLRIVISTLNSLEKLFIGNEFLFPLSCCPLEPKLARLSLPGNTLRLEPS